jgi:predicted RNase H-like HicB family nuclease
MKRELLCVAQGRGDEWEAFCLDFDLAVQGHSFEEVRGLLDEAIRTYIEDVRAEGQEAQARLVNRRVPLRVRLLWVWRFFIAALSSRNHDRDSSAWFPIACRA